MYAILRGHLHWDEIKSSFPLKPSHHQARTTCLCVISLSFIGTQKDVRRSIIDELGSHKNQYFAAFLVHPD